MALILAMAAGLSVVSCDDVIYDYEGDCTAHYRVGFRYDHNMKWADAFAHEVESVTLNLVDGNGNVVWQRTEPVDPLSGHPYAMDVDVAPGCYSLLAWAGDANQMSFEFGNTSTRGCADLTARLNRTREDSGEAVSDRRLSRLFHGHVADVEFPDTEGEHRMEVPLVKNTNYVKVVLQQVAGQPLDIDDLDVTITDDNGMMEWDNSLRHEETITYRPWALTPIAADLGASTDYNGVMAEFSTARLMVENRNDARLTVRNRATGTTIFSVKLIEFLLLVKGEYNRGMDDQEYLDRQDAYDLVFFLDEGHRWMDTYIYINSWKVVLQDIEFDFE